MNIRVFHFFFHVFHIVYLISVCIKLALRSAHTTGDLFPMRFLCNWSPEEFTLRSWLQVFVPWTVHKQCLEEQVIGTCPKKLNQFEFVGLVAGTKFRSLQLDFASKMASSLNGTCLCNKSQVLVPLCVLTFKTYRWKSLATCKVYWTKECNWSGEKTNQNSFKNPINISKNTDIFMKLLVLISIDENKCSQLVMVHIPVSVVVKN